MNRLLSSALLALGLLAAAPAQAQTFTFTGGDQTLAVPADGSYRLTARGADGGSTGFWIGSNGVGGSGAEVAATFPLQAGDELTVVVGGVGANASPSAGGGGGGGSAVIVERAGVRTLLLVAGGAGASGEGQSGGGGTSIDGTAGGGSEVGGGGGGGGGFNDAGESGFGGTGGAAGTLAGGGDGGSGFSSANGGFGFGGGGGGSGGLGGGGGGFGGGDASFPVQGGSSFVEASGTDGFTGTDIARADGATGGGSGRNGEVVVEETTPAACAAGTFSATGNAPCTAAPSGTFIAGAGATEATLCGVGFFQPDEGQTFCLPAPAGRYVDIEGADVAAACELGTFQPEQGQTSCLVAPVGFYVAVTAATEATACPDGQTTLGVGSTSLADCFALGPSALPLADVSLTFPGGLVLPAGRGSVFVTGAATFTGTRGQRFTVFLRLDGPGGFSRIASRGEIKPRAGQSVSQQIKLATRGSDPAGAYTVSLIAELGSVATPGPGAEVIATLAATKLGGGLRVAERLTVYPNPATDAATLRFSVAEAGEATLVIYDALGREVARPVDGAVEGLVEAGLDAGSLPAGLYLARLTTAGGRSETVRLSVAC